MTIEAFSDTVPQRVWDRIFEQVNECWQYRGAHDDNGYPCVRISRQTVRVYRYLYQEIRGDIPAGLVLDHVGCSIKGTKWCCNPWHVEPTTNVDNWSREKVEAGLCAPPRHGCEHGTTRCAECRRTDARNKRRVAKGIPLDAPVRHQPPRGCEHNPLKKCIECIHRRGRDRARKRLGITPDRYRIEET